MYHFSKARPEGKEHLVPIAKPRKPHYGGATKMESLSVMLVAFITNFTM